MPLHGQRLVMASKRAERQRIRIEPLYPLFFVSSGDTIEIPAESVRPELVGGKAYGLSLLPKSWSLPFIVVSEELSSIYVGCKEADRQDVINRWAKRIIAASLSVGITEQDPIIVRSSGHTEGLEERGKFYSINGTLSDIHQALASCLQKVEFDKELNTQKIPLVVQKFAAALSAKGHLSNERRFYRENRDWIGNFEEIDTEKSFHIALRYWRKRIPASERADKPLVCNLSAQISEVLKIPAAWAYERGTRVHFEWVWDGTTIYLVQADQERDASGVDPRKIHRLGFHLVSGFEPKCLKRVDQTHAAKFEKIHSVFTYMQVGLPITQLYVLDSQSMISDLALGIVPPGLDTDLVELVKASLVIRTDISTQDKSRRQLLPRTEEVRELNNALQWLKEQSAKMKKEVNDDIIFIFHNFIPAVASAFALAAPGKRNVQIEALWGLPEGLYYYAHDKYVVDTLNPRGSELRSPDMVQFQVKSKPYFKKSFVSPNENGHWTTETVKPPADWQLSVRRLDWVKEIALESRRIAEAEGKLLSIMWFIGVPNSVCARPVFPWAHEVYDQAISGKTRTHRAKTPFDKSLVIRTSEDIEQLRLEAEQTKSSVRLVTIQPCDEKLLRDKDTLHKIGQLAQKIDAVILMEGGVLSHAYYQLMQTNATVEVKHPFEDLEDKQEFNKLVRDKVPSNIEFGGEIVNKARLSGETLLRALREKLVEEAFEVLEATDQESIVMELADVTEIVEGILSQLGVSRHDLEQRQEKKREKAGGFREGVVLLETRNPLAVDKKVNLTGTLFNDDREIKELAYKIKEWSDRREHQAATEVILHLVIPMVREQWTASTPETVVDLESGSVALAKITGKRVGSDLHIKLSVFSPGKQPRLL